MPEISVLMPAYIDTIEKSEWLNEAIKSLIQQSFTHWELILIDDCSPLPLVTEFDGDERIRRFKTSEQSGPALCRNTAVALSDSKGLLPLDADDMLADNEVLGKMHEIWAQDKSKIVYGDLRRLQRSGTGWTKGKPVGLPEYKFENVLNLNGVLPVTCLHSVQCHLASGGWKAELQPGLEDVEYWISAGKAGFCGVRIGEATLIYRKHEQSRQFALTRISQREGEMRIRIQDMHRDVYEGKLPMGCCGGNNQTVVPVQQNSTPLSARLDQVAADQKTWVEYTGQKRGQFGVVGSNSGVSYSIQGIGFKFEVHNADLSRFRVAGRGMDFQVGVMPPSDYVEPEPVKNPPYKPPEPTLAVIEQLDEMAASTKEFTVIENEIKAEAIVKEKIISQGLGKIWPIEPDEAWLVSVEEHYDLSPLKLGALQNILQSEGWSIEKLAQAKLDDLLPYPKIGQKRAEIIIKKAQEYLNG